MKIMIFVLLMIVAPALAMNNSVVCKNPYAETSMFSLLRDVAVCNNAEHAGCRQMRASLHLFYDALCPKPSDCGMDIICKVVKNELSYPSDTFARQLMIDHDANEEEAKKCALILLENT